MQLNVEIIEHVARQFPGFVSATVHRSLDGTRVINHLQWRTVAHLAAMQRSAQFHNPNQRMRWKFQTECGCGTLRR